MKASKFTATPSEQLKKLIKESLRLFPKRSCLKKLEDSYKDGKPLVLKFGADPSRPDLHLGHTVVINKLRQLQDFGHEVNSWSKKEILRLKSEIPRVEKRRGNSCQKMKSKRMP